MTDQTAFQTALESAGGDASTLCERYLTASSSSYPSLPLVNPYQTDPDESVCFYDSGGGVSDCSDATGYGWRRLCQCGSEASGATTSGTESYNLATLTSPFSGTTTGASDDVTVCGQGRDVVFFIDLAAGSSLDIGQDSNNFDSRHSTRWGGSSGSSASDCVEPAWCGEIALGWMTCDDPGQGTPDSCPCSCGSDRGYIGTTPGNNSVSCTDDPDTLRHSWTNDQGQTERVYFIVDSYSSYGSGDFELSWYVTAAPPPPGPASDSDSLTVRGSESALYVRFQSDGSVTRDGFMAEFSCELGGSSVGARRPAGPPPPPPGQCWPGTDCTDCPTDPQCADFHHMVYDSCSQMSTDGTPTLLARDGICQVNTGECQAGTDCSDCRRDTACPGVTARKPTPCQLRGIPCDEYVPEDEQYGAAFVSQCGLVEPASGLNGSTTVGRGACAPSDCSAVSTESAVVSVVYLECPDLATVLGSAMGYLFAVEILATTGLVTLCVLLAGGSCRSAWEHTRTVLRADAGTEEAESEKLLEEHKRASLAEEEGADVAKRPVIAWSKRPRDAEYAV